MPDAAANGSLDKRLRQRVLDVLLQRSPQRTRAVAAIDHRLVKDPLAGILGNGDGDGPLRQVLIELVHHQLDDLDQVGLS